MKVQPMTAELPMEAADDQATVETYRAAGKLQGKTALITGGDSGIGRAIAVLFAKEGATVAIAYISETRPQSYLPKEQEDAHETQRLVTAAGSTCHLLPPLDLGYPENCQQVIDHALTLLPGGRIDILINNASEQHVTHDFAAIPLDQIDRTFRSNILNYMYMTKLALPHMPRGGKIINTTSVTAFKGKSELVDYSATKGAMVAFTRSLALQLAPKGIRINAVAPGPVWTPLIPATFDEDQIKSFGASVPLGRMGQPAEVATCYVFLASSDSSYMTGQILHPNGGSIVGS
ncbi:short-chain dehydrogenase/reductase SDR [Catenaria anguillulae PL171]|uniref:Short-chain dehydrogenase/reductase SDR n=1 Tax=Catenaria anguillulae PL171 TaxID=765915 RepID=A0A1Y2HB32_9FUNG|nr:short-chain dehydrogenase/reductase SDR [Catenaria anguillulae PL171]